MTKNDLTYLRLGRWLGALKSPTILQDNIKAVENHLDQVRQLCEELLNKRVDVMNKKVDELNKLNIGTFCESRKIGDIRGHTN